MSAKSRQHVAIWAVSLLTCSLSTNQRQAKNWTYLWDRTTFKFFLKFFVLLDELDKTEFDKIGFRTQDSLVSFKLSNHYTTESIVLVVGVKLHLIYTPLVLSNLSDSSNWKQKCWSAKPRLLLFAWILTLFHHPCTQVGLFSVQILNRLNKYFWVWLSMLKIISTKKLQSSIHPIWWEHNMS